MDIKLKVKLYDLLEQFIQTSSDNGDLEGYITTELIKSCTDVVEILLDENTHMYKWLRSQSLLND